MPVMVTVAKKGTGVYCAMEYLLCAMRKCKRYSGEIVLDL